MQALLEIGDDGSFDIFQRQPWPDYREQFGLSEAHIPTLITMLTDAELLSIESDDAPYYAPAHALRALGQLQAQEAIQPIIQMFHEWDHREIIWEDFPEVLSMVGPEAIPHLKAYLRDATHSESARGHAVDCLGYFANQHPEHEAECSAILTTQLEQYADNGYELNASLISALARLKAEDALTLIEKAYEADVVEGFIISLDDVYVLMGLRDAPDRPLSLMNMFGPPPPPASSKKADAAKKKKRKEAKKARKKNRRKK